MNRVRANLLCGVVAILGVLYCSCAQAQEARRIDAEIVISPWKDNKGVQRFSYWMQFKANYSSVLFGCLRFTFNQATPYRREQRGGLISSSWEPVKRYASPSFSKAGSGLIKVSASVRDMCGGGFGSASKEVFIAP